MFIPEVLLSSEFCFVNKETVIDKESIYTIWTNIKIDRYEMCRVNFRTIYREKNITISMLSL